MITLQDLASILPKNTMVKIVKRGYDVLFLGSNLYVPVQYAEEEVIFVEPPNYRKNAPKTRRSIKNIYAPLVQNNTFKPYFTIVLKSDREERKQITNERVAKLLGKEVQVIDFDPLDEKNKEKYLKVYEDENLDYFDDEDKK